MTSLILLKEWINTTVEAWKPIEGFVGYDVSNLGRVRTFWATSGQGRKWCQVLSSSARLRKLATDKDGYTSVGLRKDGKTYNRRVHQLVARAFIPNPRAGVANIPNHINNVSDDNRQANLEWMTISENTLYANDIGVGKRGEKHSLARLKEADVLEIRANVHNHDDAKRYAARFGCTYQNIDRIMKRQSWASL